MIAVRVQGGVVGEASEQLEEKWKDLTFGFTFCDSQNIVLEVLKKHMTRQLHLSLMAALCASHRGPLFRFQCRTNRMAILE